MKTAGRFFTFIVVPDASSRLHKVRISISWNRIYVGQGAWPLLNTRYLPFIEKSATIGAMTGIFWAVLFCLPAQPMKRLCSVIITAVLLMHLQCGASCLAGSPGN